MRVTVRHRSFRQYTHPTPIHRADDTRVLVIGNSPKFIERISSLLADEAGMHVVGGAKGREQAAERTVLLRPDVIVLDINQGYELGGVDLAFGLRKIAPTAAFVLISPFADAERLAMVPRGLGMEFSYLLAETALDGRSLAQAVHSASWSIPYIDSKIDQSQLGELNAVVQDAVAEVVADGRRRKSLGGADRKAASEWGGKVINFRLSEDGGEA